MKLRLHSNCFFSIVAFLSLFQIRGNATNITGYVNDKNTNEPLIGAVVYLEGTTYNATVNLDGSYEIKNVTKGNYKIKCQYIGYTAFERNINVTNDAILTLNINLEESTKIMSEVIITAQANRETEESARKSEQKSNSIVNILSAKTIQLLPDVTVGNVLQRVSGVSITRNSSGDGQYAIIRGMDKRYNYTTVNGIQISSPDNKNRYIPMDIFPADLLERLEVTKSLTPNLEGNAIGGAMNMVMKSAPERFIVNATVSTGYSEIFGSRPFSGFSTDGLQLTSIPESKGFDYIAKPSDFSTKHLVYTDVSIPLNTFASVSVGDRFLNNKLGVLVAGSYSRAYRGGNTLFYNPATQPTPEPANTPTFDAVEDRKYSNLQTRIGTHAQLDYVINRDHKISWYNLFVQLEENQHREIFGNTLTGFGDIPIYNRSRYQKQNIYASIVNGEHNLGDLRVDWKATYSRATNNLPDWADFQVKYVISKDINGNKVRTATYVEPITHRWTHNEDNDKSAFIDLTYNVLQNLEIKGGGMYRTRNKSNFFTEYTLSGLQAGLVPQPYTTIEQAKFSFIPASSAIADTTDGNNYTASEDIYAGYLQGKVTFDKLQVYGGVRAEHTLFKWYSQVPPTTPGKFGTKDYLDILPSIHFKYALSDKENVRLSYFAGISRPNFYEVIPYRLVGDVFTEEGNPYLVRTTSSNIDLRYELFPRGTEQVLIGAFYKYIKDPIEFGFEQKTNNSQVLKPFNGDEIVTGSGNPTNNPNIRTGTAYNYGLEVVLSKYYKNFGITANYTYTKSSITSKKKIYYRNSAGNLVTEDADQTRPLQGQSDHIANVSLIYKNAKAGFDAQIAWVYTGSRINIVSRYKDLDYWQAPLSQIDFSGEKKMGKHFSIFIKATNLFDNALIVNILHPNTADLIKLNLPEQVDPNLLLVQRDLFGRSYTLGLRYKL